MNYLCGKSGGVPMVWSWNGTTLTDLAAPATVGATRFTCLYHDGTRLWAGDDAGYIYRYSPAGWELLPWTPPMGTYAVMTILEYDDGVNGNLLYVLISRLPSHGGPPGAASLWASGDDGATWTVVPTPGITGASGMMVANGILGICTGSIAGGNKLYTNTAGGEVPVDVWAPGAWIAAGPAALAAAGHLSFFAHEDIGAWGGARYALTGYEAASGHVFQSPSLFPVGAWTDDGEGAGMGWLDHPGYGPHSAYYMAALKRLYVFDWLGCNIGYYDGTAAYFMDGDVPGAGVAPPTTEGEAVAFAEDDAGDLLFCYTPANLLTGYLIRRIADSNYLPVFSGMPNTGFYDMVHGAAISFQRTIFDVDGETQQGRIRPQEIDPLEGEWVFLLGSEQFLTDDVEWGDRITLRTTWDFTADPLAYFGIFIRARRHSTTPSTLWRWSVTVGGVPWAGNAMDKDFDPGWYPVMIPTGKLTGSQDIEFTLQRQPV